MRPPTEMARQRRPASPRRKRDSGRAAGRRQRPDGRFEGRCEVTGDADQALQRLKNGPRSEQIARRRDLLSEATDASGGRDRASTFAGPLLLSPAERLTAAERQVLDYLPTHLMIAEIADL